MIRPQVCLSDWVKKHHLTVEEYDCPNCLGKFDTDVPFVTTDYYGIESPIHEPCGSAFTKVVMTPRSPSAKERWRKISEQL